ncbi:MAG: imidazole glycerol phosphate synthase subunit HisH [Pseudolabrys sp.]|nr:imidazole glycerol phosphate synthase subunit HisH [Pseudolabrys sp.]
MAAGLTVVVDYGLCNIDSMIRALEECGATQVERTRDPRQVDRADRIVLPGVGNFAAAMRNLKDWGLLTSIKARSASREVPFLGACLGMQLMATSGEEGSTAGPIEGLGLVDGEVVKLQQQNADERIPHIGWNEVARKGHSGLFDGIPEAGDFYFVHSYHMKLRTESAEAGRTPVCGGFTSAIALTDKPIFGTQFHPEKSQKNGFQLLRNFLAV